MNTVLTNRLKAEVITGTKSISLPAYGTGKNDLQFSGLLLGMRVENKYFLAVSMIISIVMLLAATGEVSAGKFETPINRKVSDILPPEMISGPHYRIRDKIVSYGYMHHYTVDSDFGSSACGGAERVISKQGKGAR